MPKGDDDRLMYDDDDESYAKGRGWKNGDDHDDSVSDSDDESSEDVRLMLMTRMIVVSQWLC